MAFQNYFASKISNDIGAGDNTIVVDNAPTATSGRMALEARNSTQREIIKYTNVSGNTLTGVTRGQGGTTAKSHIKGALIEMNVTAQDLQDLYDAFNSFAATNTTGWFIGANLPTTIAYQGNRNYLATFNGVDLTAIYAEGMKVKATRTTAAPTQAATSNGSTSYLTKVAPNKMTATDNLTFGATIRIPSIPTGGDGYFMGRTDSGAIGWGIAVTANGQLQFYNATAGSNRRVFTHLKVFPNREYKVRFVWVAGVVTIYIDGQAVNTYTTTGGAPPTTVTQNGDYSIGRLGAATGNNYTGEVSQVFFFDAALTQTQIRAIDSQGLTGTETNLRTAHSLNNSLLDLNTTTPNDLTNVNSVTFANGGGFGNYGQNTNLEFGVVVTKPVFSAGNTTFQIQVPPGCTLPTSATPLSAIAYSPHQAPLGYPVKNILVKEYVQSAINTSVIPVGNGDVDLASNGVAVSVFVPFDMTIEASVEIGIGATSDFEFRPEIRVDGSVYVKMTPAAALGSAGARAMTRGFTYSVALTAGYHVISAGLELIAGGGYNCPAGSAVIMAAVPLEVMV